MEPQSLHKISELLDMLEQTAGEPGDLTNTLRRIVETAGRFFNTDDCMMYAINPITGRFLEPLIIANDTAETKIIFKQPREQKVTQQVIGEKVVFVENVDVMGEYYSPFTRNSSIHAFVGLALYTKYHQKILGILYLGFKCVQSFTADNRELLQLFAEQASYILQETWLVRRYREVARVGQEINQELATVEILFQKLQQHVEGILDISHTLLLAVYLSPTKMLDIYMSKEGEIVTYNDLSPEGSIKYVLETQKPLFEQNMYKGEEHSPFQEASIPGIGRRESVILVPLILRGVSMGALSIQHPEPNAYNEEDRFILELLGNHIALALYNIRLYDSLNRLNETGQFLTQQINSAQVLQETVDKIWKATEADSVILYPYDPTLQRFILPPRLAGVLQDPIPLSATFFRPHDIVVLALQHAKPILARQGATIYAKLSGGPSVEGINFQQRENIQSVAIIPLCVGEVSVGVLFLNFCQAQQFDSPQKSLMEGLALYAAIAIKNAQAFGSLRERRVRELEVLQSIDRELSRPLELDLVLDTILRLGQKHVPAEDAYILLYDHQKNTLETAAVIGRYEETSRTQVIVLDETKSITNWALKNKKSVRANNVHQELPWRDLYLPVAPDIISELDVPMLDGDEVVGILNFESTREGAFSKEEELFLITLAGQAVLAVKKAQAYEREKRSATESRAFSEISQEIAIQLDPVKVFYLILEKALQLTRAVVGSFHLYDPEQGLYIAAEYGVAEYRKDHRQKLGEGIVGYVAEQKNLLNIEDVTQLPWNEMYMESFPGMHSELAVPMLEGNEVRGVLNVESVEIGHFKEGDEQLLKGLTDLAVVTLQSTERYKKAGREAQHSAMLYKAGRELANITDWEQFEQACDIILRIAEEHSHCQGTIRRYNEDTQELVLIRSLEVYQYFKPYPSIKLDEGLNGYVARERRTRVIHNTNDLPQGVVLKLANLAIRSLVVTPIQFKDRYYGNLSLGHREAGYFRGNSDISFFEGLADQLASTIYRLETTKARQEFEQVSSIGHSAFELTHRLANDLGLVEFYVSDIQWQMRKFGIADDEIVAEKLNDIVQSVQKVLSFSEKLKQELTKPVEEKFILISPQELLEDVVITTSLPSTIQMDVKIDDGVGTVRVIRDRITDILRNLVSNAIDAMSPHEGKITLQTRNIGHFVALEVTDTGVGIPQQQQAKIFDLSFSTKGSSGFGLWSARRNALLNRGELKVESRPGHTTFMLLLPRTDGGKV